MATRFYLVPKVGTGQTIEDVYRPKYVRNGLGQNVMSGANEVMDYGLEPVYLVAADVTPAEHTALVANSDVTAFPANLDASVGANLATVTGKLDAFGVPSEWVTTATMYRQLLRLITRLIQLAQRFHFVANQRLLPSGITLDSTVGSLSAQQRAKLAETIASFPNGTAGAITAGMTLRAALRTLADQIQFTPRMLDTDL